MLKALFISPSGFNLSFKIVEQIRVMIPDKVIIVTIKNGITPPNTSLSTPAQKCHGQRCLLLSILFDWNWY